MTEEDVYYKIDYDEEENKQKDPFLNSMKEDKEIEVTNKNLKKVIQKLFYNQKIYLLIIFFINIG